MTSPLALTATAAPQLQLDEGTKTYIVQLADKPIASYEGGTAGIPATKPVPGEKVKARSANARAYEAFLRQEQREALREADIPADRKEHEYTVALNGFAARLTESQAAKLAKTDGVVNVWEDEVRHADTVSTPDYLGLDGRNGVWKKQFGNPHIAGRGVVVGVIDTGIDPDNPSFAQLGRSQMRAGDFVCDTGEDVEFECSDKIIGARYYGAEYGNNVAYDFNSPRDTNGHGSHTAGTAAGNYGVPMSVGGTDLGEGSGMAPGARVAVYKALWQTADGTGSGTTAGLVQAINDAVADGVDVINYSISGSRTSVVSADELAFLGAADAGIFVATSAGNSGDTVGESSVAHNSPWTMTVAASTHDRGAEKTVTLGDGSTYDGVGVGDEVSGELVLAADIPADGASAQAARECWLDADTTTAGQQPSLDPTAAAGKIVICDRGTVDRVHKSAAVELAGGIGMIQTNTDDAQSLNADFHSVPSIHVSATDGAAIKAYEASAGTPTATISAMSTDPVNAPVMAGFSSYGPALAGGGDLLKPDITAPGVDVLAAYHEDLETGEPTFNQISGTSMSAPHIAGLAALMKQKFPSWSPMAIKSAMMTTARQTDDAGQPIQWSQGDATPLNYGAGEVVPADSYNPGLVYDSDIADWFQYACSIDQLQMVGGAEVCTTLGDSDPSDLNYPSIAIGDLAGTQTVTRTVTNVNRGVMQYRAEVEAPAGTRVEVSPSRLTLRPGMSADFEVTITRTDAPLGEYTFGSLTWVPMRGGNEVRSPLAVRPVAAAAPDEVVGSGTAGEVDLTVTPGFTGTLGTDVDGLLASDVEELYVEKTEGTVLDGYFFFDVPAGTTATRVATFSEEVEASDIDLNLYRFVPPNSISLVAGSGNADSTESVTARDLQPGTYVAAVDLWSEEASVTAPVHVWNVGDADAGNLSVTPASVAVTQGTPTTLTAAWSGLDASQRYLGVVNFLEGATVAASTLVTVNP